MTSPSLLREAKRLSAEQHLEQTWHRHAFDSDIGYRYCAICRRAPHTFLANGWGDPSGNENTDIEFRESIRLHKPIHRVVPAIGAKSFNWPLATSLLACGALWGASLVLGFIAMGWL